MDPTTTPENIPAPATPAQPPAQTAPPAAAPAAPAAPPSGATTPAGQSLAPVITGIVDYLGTQIQGNPIEAAVFSYAKAALSGTGADAVGALLGMGPVTLKSVIDAAFTHLESIEQRPIVQWATRALNTLIDVAGLPALQIFLASKGIVIPLS